MPIDMNTVSGSYFFDNNQLNPELIILMIALVYHLKNRYKTFFTSYNVPNPLCKSLQWKNKIGTKYKKYDQKKDLQFFLPKISNFVPFDSV